MLQLDHAQLSSVKLIATDMDGTLTQEGKFTSQLLTILESLAAKNIPVLIVTGRSAGWVSGIAHYLPITGAIAENGGLFYNNQNQTSELITDINKVKVHRSELKQVFQLIQNKFPQIKESSDNKFRLTDWTFDISSLKVPQLETMNSMCRDAGFDFTYSTVQCHIKPQQQDKATALQQVIKKHFSHLTPHQVVTVGDSPNDESLFNSDYFPLSVGVANIKDYCDRLQHQPQYVTHFTEVQGFCELITALT